MPIFKKITIVLIASLVLIFAFFWFSAIPSSQAQAVTEHIKVEVSKDGSHWYNYSGDDNPGGETLSVDPGDWITVRVKVWNTDVAPVIFVGQGSLTNHDYIVDFADFDADADGNANPFLTNYFEDINGGIANVAAGGSENAGFESMTIKLKLSSDFPIGTTYILGTANAIIGGPVNVEKEDNQQNSEQSKSLFGIQRAYAQVPQFIDSSFRIAVNGGLPDTGADL